MPIERVISGGQTGVDRAALRAARSAGLDVGGWCPKGRRSDDGPISDEFPMQETPSAGYPTRTRWNIRDADATLVLYEGPLEGGTAHTLKLATALGRPAAAFDVAQRDAGARIRDWIAQTCPRVLNVAGPREGKRPGIGARAHALLAEVFARPAA